MNLNLAGGRLRGQVSVRGPACVHTYTHTRSSLVSSSLSTHAQVFVPGSLLSPLSLSFSFPYVTLLSLILFRTRLAVC